MKRLAFTLAAVALLLARPSGQSSSSEWAAWARQHAVPIGTLQSAPDDTFEDLQFLKTVLGDRRIVQLGESGHGVAEFNTAKVRLIKFLHQQMGFDVMAFESGLNECYTADGNVSLSAESLMRSCIFGVWHANETLPLFDYIKSTHATDRRLTLAGFDTQISSGAGIRSRPAMFGAMVRVIDAARATSVETLDEQYIDGVRTGAGYAVANEAKLTEFYGDLELLLQNNRSRLQEVFGRELPIVAERSAWSMLRFLEQLRAGTRQISDPAETGGAIRDFGMAANLAFLANDLYPGRKIIVWAHNFHIRHANAATTSRQPTMGQWVKERFGDRLYTMGLYMNQGTAALNNRAVYSIAPASENSMEGVLARAGAPIVFMDLLHQERVTGNSWMFESTSQREWGQNPPFNIVPRNQYDGILFIDTVKPPSYLPF